MIDDNSEEQIRKQLIQQIESTFPENKKKEAINQINEMNNSQLKEFLIKNNLIKVTNSEENKSESCIFCSIVKKKVPSYEIDENKDAIAILEINPISVGHVLIIPKKHDLIEKIPSSIFSLAKKIAKKIKTKLKPKDIIVSSSNWNGHAVINIIPIYGNENLNSPRYSANEEELKKIQKKLEKKIGSKKVKKKEIQKKKEEYILPKRIP